MTQVEAFIKDLAHRLVPEAQDVYVVGGEVKILIPASQSHKYDGSNNPFLQHFSALKRNGVFMAAHYCKKLVNDHIMALVFTIEEAEAPEQDWRMFIMDEEDFTTVDFEDTLDEADGEKEEAPHQDDEGLDEDWLKRLINF